MATSCVSSWFASRTLCSLWLRSKQLLARLYFYLHVHVSLQNYINLGLTHRVPRAFGQAGVPRAAGAMGTLWGHRGDEDTGCTSAAETQAP